MDKHKYLSIKDFAEFTGVKETTLRYYDKLGIFCPSARDANGYRYYSPYQMVTIKTIVLLQDLEVPTKIIGDLMLSRNPEKIVDLLSTKEAELAETLREATRFHNVVKTILRVTNLGLMVQEETVKLEYLEESPIILGQENSFSTAIDWYAPFLRFCRDAELYNIDIRLPIGGLWTSFDAYLASPDNPSHFFSIDPAGIQSRAAGTYVTGHGRGYYGESGGLDLLMKSYIEEHGIEVTGPVYTAYLLNELSIKEPSNYLMRTAVAVAQPPR